MGIFGAGNAGSALTKFLAPALIAWGSWQLVPQVFSAILFITALLFWFLTSDNKAHRVASSVSLREQLAALKDRPCGATASTTRSCSAVTWRWRCG